LRRGRHPVLALSDLIGRVQEGREVPDGAVVLTVDDGYADFLTAGLPLFTRYECPVTLFVTTGFVDGRGWMWWDRLLHVLRQTPRREVVVLGRQFRLERSSPAELSLSISLMLEKHPWDVVERELHELAGRLEVEPAETPPEEFAPLTWEELRASLREGVEVAPHTRTHPVLSRVDDARAEDEIVGSWLRLRQEVPDALPVFCYPSGRTEAFGAREIGLVRAAGLHGAVTTRPDYVRTRLSREEWQSTRWCLPRFACPASLDQLRSFTSGLERFKRLLRPLWAGPAWETSPSSGETVAQ
jgi:peptidoglycan/xylan/chitin deacetylase (PgdA/CDA1 family)